MAITITLFVIGIFLIGIVLIYNKMVRNRNRMQEAWSIIDVFLRKRADLVPALVEVVKGYSNHEKTLLEEVTRFRSATKEATTQEARMESANGLAKALGNLIVVVENYPELKANEHFLQLQKELSSLEGEIEKARRYYNGTVRENNTYIESVPNNFVAVLFKMEKGLFFTLDPSETATPDITI